MSGEQHPRPLVVPPESCDLFTAYALSDDPDPEAAARAIAEPIVVAELTRLAEEFAAVGPMMAGGYVVVDRTPAKLRRRVRQITGETP